MKKNLFVAIVFVSLSIRSQACDICGCGVSNYYIGILPQFNYTFFGFRYHVSSYHTRLLDDPTQFSKDFYQSTELWAGWNIGARFRVLAFLPYNFNRQNSDEGVTKKSGLGDMIVVGSYKLMDVKSMNGNNKVVSQQLWVGGGVKLPTGKFDIDPSDPDVAAIANGQLGSGSTDLLLNAMYNLRIDKFGINTSFNYKMNTANKENYRFGDRLSLSGFVYYALHAPKIVISPNVGLLYDHTDPSRLQNSKINLTGGNIVNGALGAELSLRKVSIGFNVQVPVAQNFAENQTKENIKGMVHVTLAI